LPFDLINELTNLICSSLSFLVFEKPEVVDQMKITQTNIASDIRKVGYAEPKAPIIKKKLTIVAAKNFPNPVITNRFK